MNKLVIIGIIVGLVIGIGVGYAIVQPQLNDVNIQLENSQSEIASIRSLGAKLETALVNRDKLDILVLKLFTGMDRSGGNYDDDTWFFTTIEDTVKELGSAQLNTYYERVMTDIRNKSNQTYFYDKTQFLDQWDIEFEQANNEVDSLLSQIKG